MKHTSINPGQRQLRVAEQVRHALVDILHRGHFRDPDLEGQTNLMTVTEVRISPDLKNATAYIIPLGNELSENFMIAINHASSYIRGELAKRLNLRFTPRISFEYDHSFDYAQKIDSLLRHDTVARDLEGKETARTGTE